MVECYKKRMETKDGSVKYYYMKKTGGKMVRIGADEYSAMKKRQAGGADTPPIQMPPGYTRQPPGTEGYQGELKAAYIKGYNAGVDAPLASVAKRHSIKDQY